METGKIIKIISNQYTILTQTKEQKIATAMGKLRKNEMPVVGDEVLYEIQDGKYLIQKVLPRKNFLIRPLIANVDQAIIVMSLEDPVFSHTLVDRLIFLVSYQQIEPVLLITKTDLATSEDQLEAIVQEYSSSGYRVYTSSNEGSNEVLKQVLEDKITVLTGQSGVGKSSLLNRLDEEFQLQTQETSKALGRGKHTTRHVQLYPLANGWVADTPGFSSLDFSAVESAVLRERILDFQMDEPCRFRDCTHTKEPGCAIKQAVEEGRISRIRYENYLQVLPLCDKIKEWEK
ncbi:MAG: ribosome small subunit-dependent GTPase A [Erysipelotrichaceae bacterium]|nr:ribosome small subunit-dependent GTPase A [Erysipelotrichaceae bacterium]